MHMRVGGGWAMNEGDGNAYNVSLEVGNTLGDGKWDDLVYHLIIQPHLSWTITCLFQKGNIVYIGK
jgi:hypothetical protein